MPLGKVRLTSEHSSLRKDPVGNRATHIARKSKGTEGGPGHVRCRQPKRRCSACTRRIDLEGERRGYDVLYREFEGEHMISSQITIEAVDRLTQEEYPQRIGILCRTLGLFALRYATQDSMGR